MLVDYSRDAGLGSELIRLRDLRRELAGLDEADDVGELPLFDVQPAKFLEEWRSAVSFLQCDLLCHTPYQNRHGGPSRDIQLRLRTLLEVQRCGHWQSATSLRNYKKAARLSHPKSGACLGAGAGRAVQKEMLRGRPDIVAGAAAVSANPISAASVASTRTVQVASQQLLPRPTEASGALFASSRSMEA